MRIIRMNPFGGVDDAAMANTADIQRQQAEIQQYGKPLTKHNSATIAFNIAL